MNNKIIIFMAVIASTGVSIVQVKNQMEKIKHRNEMVNMLNNFEKEQKNKSNVTLKMKRG